MTRTEALAALTSIQKLLRCFGRMSFSIRQQAGMQYNYFSEIMYVWVYIPSNV
jgi:hypothetical protein